MSLTHGPNLNTTGLILALDAANPKSYNPAENLLLYSEQLNNATGWTQQTSTVTADQYPDPSNRGTADQISSPSDVGIYQAATVVSGAVYTASIYLMIGVGTSATNVMLRDQGGTGHHVIVNTSTLGLTQVNLISAGLIPVGNNWYRLWMTYTTDSTGCLFTIRPDSQGGTTNIIAWGAQLERNAIVTPYTATTGVAVTRSTTWYDVSGQNNTTALVNLPTYNTDGLGSFTFNGTSSYANVSSGTSIMSNTAYTKLVFFKCTDFTKNNNLISYAGQHNLWLGGTTTLSAGHARIGTNIVNSVSTLTANVWYHGAVTFDTTTGWKLYLNGNLETVNSSVASFIGSGAIEIGSYGGGNLFAGNIAIPTVYNRVLQPDEIKSHFERNRKRFGI